MSGIADRLAAIRARIGEAARRAGRDPGSVTLIGVTKTVGAGAVVEAVAAGLLDLGENRVQEAERKIPLVPASGAPVTWHLVGRLQANKARRAAALFPVIHSIDSASLATRLGRLAAEEGVRPSIFVEVNVGGEDSKAGARPGEMGPILEAIAAAGSLRLVGLMAVPPPLTPGAPAEAARPWFRALRETRDTWASRGYDLPALSMGMTDDFEIAVEEGATHVRVGRAIFGERPPPRQGTGGDG